MVTGFAPEQWAWANTQMPSNDPATLSIETGGVYTLTAAMAEDGLRLDRLLLTTDTTFIPSGYGPAETAREMGTEHPTQTLTRTIVYTYDDLYRLVEATYSSGEFFGYAYDPLGNQTAITETVQNTVVTTYTYNAANQLLTARADDDGITWHYTHDARGNLRRQTPGGTDPAEGETRYTYDAADRLVQVHLYTGGSYTLLSRAQYNGDGERVALTTYALGISRTVRYVVGQEGELLVSADGSQATLYLHGQTLLAEYGSAWSYPLNDETGSPRQVVADTGAVTLARSYKPFGGTLQEQGVYETAIGFMGGQLDRLSGLLYANGRYYDPSTGRYLTPAQGFDPYRPGTLNPYAPVQGPGWWLLLPFVGIVLLRRRKGGPWRMLVLVWVVGLGLSLVSCGGGGTSPPTAPGQTMVTQPPATPTSQPSSTATPTSTGTPIPTVPAIPTIEIPSPTLPPIPTTPCPPTDTPTTGPTPTSTPYTISEAEINKLARMVYTEQSGQGKVIMRHAAWVAINRIDDTKFYPNATTLDAALDTGFAIWSQEFIDGRLTSEEFGQYETNEWEKAQQVAREVVASYEADGNDPTDGAIFFANIRMKVTKEDGIDMTREEIIEAYLQEGQNQGLDITINDITILEGGEGNAYFISNKKGSITVPCYLDPTKNPEICM